MKLPDKEGSEDAAGWAMLEALGVTADMLGTDSGV